MAVRHVKVEAFNQMYWRDGNPVGDRRITASVTKDHARVFTMSSADDWNTCTFSYTVDSITFYLAPDANSVLTSLTLEGNSIPTYSVIPYGDNTYQFKLNSNLVYLYIGPKFQLDNPILLQDGSTNVDFAHSAVALWDVNQAQE